MQYAARRKLIHCLFAAALLGTLATLGGIAGSRSQRPGDVQAEARRLAPDVDLLVNDFKYNDDLGGGSHLTLKAKRLVSRGRKILAFRSNLVKDNVFEEVSGRVATQRSEVTFAGDLAEGSFNLNGTLQLRGKVRLSVNGHEVPVRRTARIVFARKLIEVDEDATVSYAD